MLEPELPKSQGSLVVQPENVQVILAEDHGHPLALVLPPLQDLLDIEALKGTRVSLEDLAERERQMREAAFAVELEDLKTKYERFSHSPTYLNRLASLAAATGDRLEEARYLQLAYALSSDTFFAHRLGDNLIARNELQAAQLVFKGLDLRKDLEANLKLAAFHILRQEIDAARGCVDRAIQINPLSFAARLFEGGLHLVCHAYDKAVAAFRLASEERGTSSALYSNMGIAYIRMELHEKALTALKRAVALDPLNANAIFILADLAYMRDCNEEAIPSLRYFLQFEQGRAGMWSRLARACFHLGKTHEAMDALKRQASIQDSSSVWNNMAVAHQLLGAPTRAVQAFRHAMKLAGDDNPRDFFLAARNLVQSVSEHMDFKRLLRLTRALVRADQDQQCLADNVRSDIYAFYIYALKASGKSEEMAKEGERLLHESVIAEPLKVWLVSCLIAEFAFHEDGRAVGLFVRYRAWIDNLYPRESWRHVMLFNNVAFALADLGRTEEAERYLSRVSEQIHKNPYTTATAGLIHIRRGRMERGSEFYEEAIRIATKRRDKVLIRQKLNLELGRYWMALQPSKARRLLEKVSSEEDGEGGLRAIAERLLLALSAPPQLPPH